MIYQIRERPGFLAKIYRESPNSFQHLKLSSQVRMELPDLRECSAWPEELLFDRSNRVQGFVMRHAEGVAVHQFYHPEDRAIHFPRATWRSLVAVATNVATAFVTLHKHGVLMADVNHSNLLISTETGRVTLIDCDSYQIPRASGGVHACPVGIPEWTPPEIACRDFGKVDRTVQHDCFGLALLIFHILNNGWHPYQGIPLTAEASAGDFGIRRAIEIGAFAFTRRRSVQLLPHPARLQSTDFPRDVWDAFEDAFGTDAGKRPSAERWSGLLGGLLKKVARCANHESHYYWEDAASCPWCRIRFSGMGGEYFRGARGSSANISELEMELGRFSTLKPWILTEIDASQVLSDESFRSGLNAGGESKASGERMNLLRRILSGWNRITGTCSSPSEQELMQECLKFDEVKRRVTELVQERDEIVRSYNASYGRVHRDWLKQMTVLLEKIRGAQVDADGLPRDLSLLHAEQFKDYKEEYPVENADIPRLGEQRREALRAAGILFLDDVTAGRLSCVPGFGPAFCEKLLKWAERCRKEFQCDPTRPLSRQGRARVQEKRLEWTIEFRATLEGAIDSLAEINGQAGGLVKRREFLLKEVLLELSAARVRVTTAVTKASETL